MKTSSLKYGLFQAIAIYKSYVMRQLRRHQYGLQDALVHKTNGQILRHFYETSRVQNVDKWFQLKLNHLQKYLPEIVAPLV